MKWVIHAGVTLVSARNHANPSQAFLATGGHNAALHTLHYTVAINQQQRSTANNADSQQQGATAQSSIAQSAQLLSAASAAAAEGEAIVEEIKEMVKENLGEADKATKLAEATEGMKQSIAGAVTKIDDILAATEAETKAAAKEGAKEALAEIAAGAKEQVQSNALAEKQARQEAMRGKLTGIVVPLHKQMVAAQIEAMHLKRRGLEYDTAARALEVEMGKLYPVIWTPLQGTEKSKWRFNDSG